ncbi:MAG: MFS transporter [Pirellulaceae bacterium]
MNKAIRVKLFVMMFLEFFIWGAWLPLIFGYLPALGFTDTQQSLILNTFPVAAIVAMFFSNQFADRNFAAERFLAFSHLIGGLSMLALGWVNSFWPFFLLMAVHCLFYVPTISITNSIAFAAMRDAQQEFGIVRMGGTIGWIAVSWPFYFLFKEVSPENVVASTTWTYIVAGLGSLALAAFSLTLPHTPPNKQADGGESLAWLKSTRLLTLPFVLVLWIVTFIDAAVHQSFFSWTGRFLEDAVKIQREWIMPVMSISQVAEIATMMVLGFFLKRFGWRLTMTIGILGHAIRFGVFAFFPEHTWLIVSINVLHGVCYAFFFAAVYIFVDEYFPKDVRSSAQGLFNVMVLGLGPFVANFICPPLYSMFVDPTTKVVDFRSLFLIPAGAALFAAFLLFALFHPPRKETVTEGVSNADNSERLATVGEQPA